MIIDTTRPLSAAQDFAARPTEGPPQPPREQAVPTVTVLPPPAPFPETFHPSPEDIRREIGSAVGRELSPALASWADRYGAVGRRNLYLWKWCRQGVEVTTLPCVAPELRDDVGDTKVLGVMLDVLLDDVADQNGEDELLDRLLAFPFDLTPQTFAKFPPDRQRYANFTAEVWAEIDRRARSFPAYEEYAALLRYDYLQLFNTMRYSHLLNRRPALMNLVEHDLYTPHNMHMMISSTLDLMCSPSFWRQELGLLREAVWHGQCMGRIGNLCTTWERELGERDYTSGVYARALMAGDLSPDDLARGDRERIRRAIREGGHEEYFLARWQEHRHSILARRPNLKSFDLGDLVRGLERLICLHLGSRGFK